MHYARINRMWNDTDHVNLIDVTKRNANWQYINLAITIGYSASVEVLLVNNHFDNGTTQDVIDNNFAQDITPAAP